MDLVRAIPDIDPSTIWDLGCGTGAITRMLAARWPDASVHGLDSSASMLAEASNGDPEARCRGCWATSATGRLTSRSTSSSPTPRCIGSTTTTACSPNSIGRLSEGGVLAVQMPRNFSEPSHQVLYEVARRPRWEPRVGHRAGWCPVDEPSLYFDRLSPVCSRVDLWETVYLQVLQGEDAVAEWVKGTAARPFLEDLGDEGEAFFAEYTEALRSHYPRRESTGARSSPSDDCS